MFKKPLYRRSFVDFSFVTLSVLVASSFVFAEDATPKISISVRAERETAIYEKEETVSFQVRLTEDGRPLAGKELWYVVQGDGRYEKKGSVTSTDPFAVIEASLSRSGFLKCTVGWDGGPEETISAQAGAGVAPLEIRAETPEPADFDAFWNAKKEALTALPMNEKLVPVPAEKVNHPKVVVFDVKVDCLGGKSVSGYFARPIDAAPKSLPIIVTYHGSGVCSSTMPIKDAARGALALDINAHGIENGCPPEYYHALHVGSLKDYRWQCINDREKIYFTGMYLRVIRSLQFMKSQPEWDGKTIAVRGSSQGGGQALVAAGADPQVTFCLAFVPAQCYHIGDIEGSVGGSPGYLWGKTLETADPEVLKTVPYVDAAHFARRVKAESFLTVGFIDKYCPPTSVYVAYNNIATPKQIYTMTEEGHVLPPNVWEIGNKPLWEHIEKNRIK